MREQKYDIDGFRVKQLLYDRVVTISELSEWIDYSRETVSRAINQNKATLTMIVRISQYLEVPAISLLQKGKQKEKKFCDDLEYEMLIAVESWMNMVMPNEVERIPDALDNALFLNDLYSLVLYYTVRKGKGAPEERINDYAERSPDEMKEFLRAVKYGSLRRK